MFEHLAVHRKILVTGSFRSGTTITGQMIAHDTGHRYIDEGVFKYTICRRHCVGNCKLLLWGEQHPDCAAADRLQTHPDHPEGGIVVQCPHMFRAIVDNPPSDALVVFMRRNPDDIHRSAKRVSVRLDWFGWDDASRDDYPRAVYDYWDNKPKPPQFLEVDYDSLSSHPLFLPEHVRADFSTKQTTLDWSRSTRF